MSNTQISSNLSFERESKVSRVQKTRYEFNNEISQVRFEKSDGSEFSVSVECSEIARDKNGINDDNNIPRTMESIDNSDASRLARLKANDNSTSDNEAKTLPEKLKKIDVKPPPSPTSFLAKNVALVPSQVARLKQIGSVRNRLEMGVSSGPSVSSGSATGNPRNKTALAPGHSLMDWIRLGSSGIDLTGVGGVTRNVTLKELARHDKKNDAWIAIRGIVFNVTRYMDFHPGGVTELMRGVGKDATKLFDDVHAWVNYQSILQKCVVGRLTRGGPNEYHDTTEKSTSLNKKLVFEDATSVASRETREKANGEDINKSGSSTFKSQVDWKQTTNSLFFTYKPLPAQKSLSYRLTRLNASEFIIKIHHDNTITTHEYDLSADVNWPPNTRTNYENSEIEFSFAKCARELWDSFGSRSVMRETRSSDRIYKEYKVISNTALCEGVHYLVVQSDNYMEIMPVGRHVEAKMEVMGMEVSRYYTPVPSSFLVEHMASGYKPDCICLMVKHYDDGALSPSITALESGQTLTLSNCLGTFVIETYDECTTIHMLAAGTGLTPMLGIIQRALGRRNVKTINLVNFNRNEKNIFYASQLDRVAEDGKLKVTHVLSRPETSWQGRVGIVSESSLRELIGLSSKKSCVFICGPKGFMTVAKEALTKLQWDASQIYEFDG